MPTLARLCRHPGCRSTAERGAYACAAHARPPEPPRKRESAHARGYDRKWRRVRAHYLRKSPVCEHCGDVASEVDHITPLADGGTHRHDNLRALCKPCHSRRTAADHRGRAGRFVRADPPGGGGRVTTSGLT